ncbi:Protein SRG1 [Hibiscus syriacus]|uniref:Protein SRG1 n=1 Tax=Hibiscus syriacus TaxID=106335 RepID=A0A6A3AK92_HIBSY|nr:Protein SRG1 [Hibiscus syriacus]
MASVEVSSLLVPSVVEIAKELSTSIPSRYLRSDVEKAVVPDQALQIPVIDMQKLVSGGPNNSEIEKLDFACEERGIFQLVNHGVDSTLVENLKTQIAKFFKLPMEEKKKWWQTPGNAEGFGQAFVVSEDQKLDWGDLFFMLTHPLRLRNPRLFPTLPSPLRETMERYTSELNNLSTAMIGKIVEALHMKTEEMTEFVGEGRQTIRVNCYSPCELSDQVMGLTPHSDATLITILLQLNDVDGLVIRKDGKWLSSTTPPPPDASIINVGDILEIISNGRYCSVLHRVMVHPERERFSLATFSGLGFDGELGPAPSLISEQTPAKFTRSKSAFATRKILKKLGSSLLVPSVQELAKEPLSAIPNRYLHPEIEQGMVPDDGPMLEILVIDMQRLVSDESMDSEIDKLDFACKEWGFFQLVNHGISSTLLDKLKTQIQDFFNLPMEEKNRDAMELYSSELNKLYMAILEKMAKALNMKTGEIKELIGEGRQATRVNYYPPCHLPAQVIRLTPHSDASLITILLQLNEVEGLQIKKDGKWVPVKPLPNAFIINIGDIFEIITNGRCTVALNIVPR